MLRKRLQILKIKNFLTYFEQINRQELFNHRQEWEVCIIINDTEKNFTITTCRPKLFFISLSWAIAVSMHAELMLFQSDGSSFWWSSKPELKWAVFPVLSHPSLKFEVFLLHAQNKKGDILILIFCFWDQVLLGFCLLYRNSISIGYPSSPLYILSSPLADFSSCTCFFFCIPLLKPYLKSPLVFCSCGYYLNFNLPYNTLLCDNMLCWGWWWYFSVPRYGFKASKH